MLAVLYIVIALILVVVAVRMISHRNKSTIRALGLILAYFAAGIAMKGYFLLAVLN